MLAKRVFLAVISVGGGVAATFGITAVIGTTPGGFGAAHFTFTALSLAAASGIWLDKFMATEMLPK